MTLTGVGGVDDRAGVTEAARVVLECCSRSAAAASLPGRISPRSTRAALMVSRRRHKNIALKRMFASRGRKDCISVNNAIGQQSPRGGSSSNLKHCWRGEAVNCERRASVEALQFHSNTQSHWSSGSTICFPCRGSRVPVCTSSQWNRGGGFLLMLSRYIGDPHMIPSLALQPFSGCFTSLRADNWKSRLDRISHAFPGSIPLLAGPPPPPPGNTVTG